MPPRGLARVGLRRSSLGGRRGHEIELSPRHTEVTQTVEASQRGELLDSLHRKRLVDAVEAHRRRQADRAHRTVGEQVPATERLGHRVADAHTHGGERAPRVLGTPE